MPVVDKKGPKKPKKGADKAPPPPPVNITVRDCMVWPEPAPKGRGKGTKKGPGPDTKPNVYRSTLVRREGKAADELDDEEGRSKANVPPPRMERTRRDDGTVIEALRGWPRSRVEAEDDPRYFEVKDEGPAAKVSDPKLGKNSKQKKGKKGASKEELENVYIGDLIHQRYLNEHLEKLRREMEKEQRKKEESVSVARAGRRAALERGTIKGNRTSQLRAIALAEKVEPNPHDLWKMPRFTRDAQPRLATMRGGGGTALQGPGAGRSDQYGAYDGEGCDGGGGGCYCDCHTTNYVDEDEEVVQYGDGRCCDSPMATN